MRSKFFKSALATVASVSLLASSITLLSQPALATTAPVSNIVVPKEPIGLMVQVEETKDSSEFVRSLASQVSSVLPAVSLTNTRDLGLGWWAFTFPAEITDADAKAAAALIRSQPGVVTTSFDEKIEAARSIPIAKTITFTSSSYVPSSTYLKVTNAYDNTKPTTGQLKVSWKRPTRKPSTYTLAYATSSSGPWKTITVRTSSSYPSRTLSDLIPGTNYYFKVRAKYSSGYSSYSRVRSGKAYVQPVAVKLMTSPRVEAATAITAKWFPLASTIEFGGYSSVSYRVDVYNSSNTLKGNCTPSGTDNFCTVSGLVEDDYYAKVISINPTDSSTTYADATFGYPYFDYWYLTGNNGINIGGAWEASKGGSSTVTVAVIDTGFTASPVLKANSWWNYSTNSFYGYDFIENSTTQANYSPSNDGNGTDNNPADPGDYLTDPETRQELCSGNSEACSSWHGTQVGSIIAGWAASDQANTVIGIAPRVKLLAVRSLGPDGGSSSELARAINYSAGTAISGVTTNAHPADVINISMGTSDTKLCLTDDPVYEAIQSARAKGIIFVTAAGNFGYGVDPMIAAESYPGNCFGTINVGATNSNGDRSFYSNRGNGFINGNTYSGIDISAPGGDQSQSGGSCALSSCIAVVINTGETVPSTSWEFAANQGTSFAAPVVTAVIALMLSKNPALTMDQVADLLAENSRPFGGSTYCGLRNHPADGYYECGQGIVDASATLAAVQTIPEP